MKTPPAVPVFALFLATAAHGFDASKVYDRVDPPGKFTSHTSTSAVVFAPATNRLIVFAQTNDAPRPSIWTGNNMRLDFGHSPFERAPQIMKPTLPTNAIITPRIELKPP